MRSLYEDAMPGGCHPFYRPVYDPELVERAARADRTVIVPRIRHADLVAQYQPDAQKPVADAVDKIVLTLQKAVGQAVTVGPPAYYSWYFLRDDLGRCMGPAPGSQRRLVYQADLDQLSQTVLALQYVAQEALQARIRATRRAWASPRTVARLSKEYQQADRLWETYDRMYQHTIEEQKEQDQ